MDKKKKAKGANGLLSNWLGQLLLKLCGVDSDAVNISHIASAISTHAKPDKNFGSLKSKKPSNILIPALCLVLIPLIWYVLSVNLVHYNLSNQNIKGSKSSAQLDSLVTKDVSNYQLKISYPDGSSQKYSLSQVGLSLNNQATSASIKSSNSFFNRLAFWQPINLSAVFNKNTVAFNNFIERSTQIIVQPSKDADLNVNGGQISVSSAVAGREYGLVNSTNSLYLTAASLNTQPVKLKTLAVNPALTTTELQPYKDQLEKIISQHISFNIAGQVIQATPAQIASWLDIAPDDKNKTVNISVNSGKVEAYLDSISASMTKPPIAQVDVASSSGSQVLVPGVNGQVISGENTIATTLASKLLSGSGASDNLIVTYKPFETITAGNYPKWIEVDLTNKRLYAYQNSTLVNTYLVTAGAPATPTVTGQYAIYSKYLSQNMSGENVDGSSYFQPNVPWVNYFYSDYAIHGNYWRPTSYFGNVNSSHGCVGLMDNNAEWVYNWAPIGTPVIIHY